MANTNVKKILRIIESTEKQFGKGSIFPLGSKYENAQIPRVLTNLPDFDGAIGGGIPEGRIIELFGQESAGKTEFSYHIMAQYKLALMVDAEGTFNGARARLHGNRKGQLIIRKPDYAEEALGLIFDFAEAGIPIIVVDSVPSLIPKKEMEQTSKKFDKNAGMAMISGVLSRKLPILAGICQKSGTTVLFINQVRDNFNAGPFGDPHVTPGGRALKHNASLRMKIGRKGWLQHPKLGAFGQISKIKIVKSKVSKPYRECELPLVFDKGFVLPHDLVGVRTELIDGEGEE